MIIIIISLTNNQKTTNSGERGQSNLFSLGRFYYVVDDHQNQIEHNQKANA